MKIMSEINYLKCNVCGDYIFGNIHFSGTQINFDNKNCRSCRKKDESTQPSSEESSISAKETNTSKNFDGSTVERSIVEENEKESTRAHTPIET